MTLRLTLTFLLLAACTPLIASDYQPELYQKTELIYEDTFDSGQLNKDFWEVRQSTTWEVRDGVLHGAPSSKEFQAKKMTSAAPSHAGLKPVIWLTKLPENFVCTMRIRYDGKEFKKGFPLLDLGHHIHTLSFTEKATTLTIKKNIETQETQGPLFALNTWHDVALELKKGVIILNIDGKKHRFESPHIDMTGHSQIDFKGLDFGSCQIDHIRVWRGL